MFSSTAALRPYGHVRSRYIRPYVTTRSQTVFTKDVLTALVKAFFQCRLDYSNALRAGTADAEMKRAQSDRVGV